MTSLVAATAGCYMADMSSCRSSSVRGHALCPSEWPTSRGSATRPLASNPVASAPQVARPGWVPSLPR